MSEQDAREEIVGRFYRALISREWDEMRGVFADDAQFGMSGRNPSPASIAGLMRLWAS